MVDFLNIIFKYLKNKIPANTLIDTTHNASLLSLFEFLNILCDFFFAFTKPHPRKVFGVFWVKRRSKIAPKSTKFINYIKIGVAEMLTLCFCGNPPSPFFFLTFSHKQPHIPLFFLCWNSDF